MNKGPENRKNEGKLPPPPPRCRPLKHSMTRERERKRERIFHEFGAYVSFKVGLFFSAILFWNAWGSSIGRFLIGLVRWGWRNFPPFVRFFFCFLRFFLLVLLRQEQATASHWRNGEFHSDPVCTDPVQSFPILFCRWLPSERNIISISIPKHFILKLR